MHNRRCSLISIPFFYNVSTKREGKVQRKKAKVCLQLLTWFQWLVKFLPVIFLSTNLQSTKFWNVQFKSNGFSLAAAALMWFKVLKFSILFDVSCGFTPDILRYHDALFSILLHYFVLFYFFLHFLHVIFYYFALFCIILSYKI